MTSCVSFIMDMEASRGNYMRVSFGRMPCRFEYVLGRPARSSAHTSDENKLSEFHRDDT